MLQSRSLAPRLLEALDYRAAATVPLTALPWAPAEPANRAQLVSVARGTSQPVLTRVSVSAANFDACCAGEEG
jgi:hypothetical protein